MCKLYNPETSGINLKGIRESRNLSEDQLAAKAGVEALCITEWENELYCPMMDDIIKVCEALECDIEAILA